MSKTKKTNKKLKDIEKQYKKTATKRIFLICMVALFLLLALASRTAWIVFAKGATYKEAAYNQQTSIRVISPKRGTIYDSTGKALAVSASVDTVSINPNLISDDNKEKIARALSDIFELDYNSVYEKVASNSSFKTIIRKVENDKITQLETWMKENKITRGINIDSDSKRYYPYNNLASSLLGFCGTDNQGLYGIEYTWDDVLTGTPGRVTTLKDSKSQEIPDENEVYIPAENGSDMVLTIDYNLQSIAEKYLEQAVTENSCSRGGNVIMMDPSTGDILAMATYPDYNLNTPFEPYTEELAATWDTLSSEERSTKLGEVYKNRAVSDGYEPGSTFKILTAAIGLEENITESDVENDFYCSGSLHVGDRDIKCWKTNGAHANQTLRQALQNSCNPAFMELGARIGTRTLYKYYKAFGLFDKSGANFYGEATGNFHKEDAVTSVDLAVMSFGQRITITPLQLITAVSAVVNDGVLMQPRIVKQLINSDTNVVTNLEPVTVRQVISQETSATMRDMLKSVVTDGTGKYAAVEGYSIGGKTGTSEPLEQDQSQGYTASYIAIAPVENTQVVVLVTLYDPQGSSHEGGQIAAPVISQILSEALPYLGIPSDNAADSNTDNEDNTISVPDIKNKTAAEAKSILENAGFRTKLYISGDENEVIIKDQTPKGGSLLEKNSLICLYDSDDISARTPVIIPNLKGLTATEARNKLKEANLNINLEGTGRVISQSPSYDTEIEEGSIIKVILKEYTSDVH